MEKACDSRLFKVDVPQAFEEIAVSNRSKKCFLCSDDSRRKTCIFCAAVDNEKRLSSVQKSRRCNQRRTPPAAQKLRRNRQRKERCKVDDNFLITVPLFGSFVALVTVLFVGKGG